MECGKGMGLDPRSDFGILVQSELASDPFCLIIHMIHDARALLDLPQVSPMSVPGTQQGPAAVSRGY